MNAALELLNDGQSCWIDDLTRHMITSGALARYLTEDQIRGITTNPIIFAHAVAP